MSSSSVCSRIPQSFDIIQNASSQVVLDLHVCEGGGQVERLFRFQFGDFGTGVDMEAGHEVRGCLGTDTEEGADGFLDRRK